MKIIMQHKNKGLAEAFVSRKAAAGTIQFSKSAISDAHIQKVLSLLAPVLKKPQSEIEDEIHEKVAKFNDVATKAPILYATIKDNIVEGEVFKILQKADYQHAGAPKFSVATFYRLIRYITVEHDQFFPMRNFIDGKYLKEPKYVLVPTDKKDDQKFNSVDTAAATEDGHFIFNTKFMQDLLTYSHLKGVKPKGKKYVSNGGDIPDDYAYIEFLIMHEFMHFTYADFHYGKIIPDANPLIINWVGDFRSNYLMVKSGYEQLPMGLFNDHINYDRQNTYREMYDLVKSEFDKLNDDQQKRVQNILDEMGDEHGREGKKRIDPEGKTEQDIENSEKSVTKKAGEGKDIDSEEAAEKAKAAANEKSKGSGEANGNHQKGKDGGFHEFDWTSVRPTLGWAALIRKMITSSTASTEETYQKPNRRSITSIDVARQVGAGAVKPGEVPLPKKLKLTFVVDSSGSMTGVLPQVYSNIHALLKNHGRQIASSFYMVKFSTDWHMWMCNASAGTYAQVTSNGEKPGTPTKGNLNQLFSETIAGGTNFSSEMVSELKDQASKGYNICVFIDGDILATDNFEPFADLFKSYPRQIFAIFDDKSTFSSVCRQLGTVPNTFSHL
ncbi:hypothetical protein RsoM2USA_85 [Ralstonia phage RsoM2USA]|nr:hypothetical protein RsoM2USA_85 [Ralstonia phage RsoM2USA]